ncbi:hypothetical protein FUA23_11345 [Neolewinella aurantiaca]|uniref:Uncharacterized protein n=1 Tax=Neolewinella aurantiaca TaxID=2602767 RepID=A0A5C7FSV0_9BACT|nr:hypothetical protein [Neolewinella aurantiaca]TXF89332.1 hypothetical protein FUA23_11345 [Neolewinella aurantiaca]
MSNLLSRLANAAKRNETRKGLEMAGPRLVPRIEAIHDQLQTNELTVISDFLASNLGCGHKLVTHKAYLEHLAATLVSIYRFNGFDKRQTRDNFNAIFSSSIYKFPFPSHIDEIEEKEERLSRKKSYLNERNFRGHFTAIPDSVNRKIYSPFVIILLMNVEFGSGASLDFEFNGVRTVDPSHEEVVRMIETLSDSEMEKDFFNHENFAVCLFQINTKTNVGDYRGDIYAKAQTVADYLNTRLGYNKVTVNRSKFLQTLDFENFSSGWSSESPNAKILDYRVDFIKDNASSHLKDINDRLKYPLLYTEHLFWESKRNKDLIKLWQYLENTTPEEFGKRPVCRTVSNILLYRKQRMVDSIYAADLINVLSNMSPYDRNEFPSDMVRRLRNRDIDLDIYEATKHSQNPFVKSLGRHWKVDRKRAADDEFAKHFNDLLVEARAFRNMVLHDGNYHPALKTRLETCLPYLATQYRFQCISIVQANSWRKDYGKLITAKRKAKGY